MRQYAWVERYRPTKIDDVVLPARIKRAIRAHVEDGEFPTSIFSGPAGVGKTTMAKAIVSELGADSLFINGSKERNIDTVRDDIARFASAVSLGRDGRKYVIIDEADGLNPQSAQPAMKTLIEEFSGNCGFIMTVNKPKMLIEPIRSRCPEIAFHVRDEEIPSLCKEMYDRLSSILKANDVSFERDDLVELISLYFPDWRRVIGELQNHSRDGRLDKGALDPAAEVDVEELVGYMVKNDYTSVRSWVGSNPVDQHRVLRQLYDHADDFVEKSSVPAFVLLIGKGQFQASFSADPQINLAAILAEMMIEIEWRK